MTYIQHQHSCCCYCDELLWCIYPSVNTLRPRQNGRHFADDIFRRIFLNGNIWIPIKISLKFVPNGSINNIPALIQITAWRRPGDKPLSEPMLVRTPTHICVTGPQWVKANDDFVFDFRLEKYKEARTDQMFPDEIDTPDDTPAHIRFQKCVSYVLNICLCLYSDFRT